MYNEVSPNLDIASFRQKAHFGLNKANLNFTKIFFNSNIKIDLALK